MNSLVEVFCDLKLRAGHLRRRPRDSGQAWQRAAGSLKSTPYAPGKPHSTSSRTRTDVLSFEPRASEELQ